MKLSIVATLYHSAKYLREFHQRCSVAAQDLVGGDYEIILVNDGSPDDSLSIAVELTQSDPKLKIVDLSRNFGHHKAMMTGLDHARGDLVFLLDSDLEEQPEWLAEFHADLVSQDVDVVFGVQGARKGGWFEKASGAAYFKAFNALADVKIPRNLTTARLMRSRYVTALLLHQEREIMIAGLWQITGFDQRQKTVKKLGGSKTTYTLRKKISLLVDAVTSFSTMPLLIIFNFGLIVSLLSALYICFLLFNWAFLAQPSSGWTSLMGSIWLIGGLIISFIGVVGLYLAKIYSETKQRPYTIIRQIYGQSDE